MLSPAGRDVYANLLRDTRGMRRDQALARETWFASLRWEDKEETLFELEMLLKGLATFGNPRNHPGPPRRTPGVAHDFQIELQVLRDGLERCVELSRLLLGDKDRAFTFSRYLESVIPEDAARNQLIQDQLTQDTPIEALFVLRNGFAGAIEIANGLLKLGRVGHRMFQAFHGIVTREIGRNVFFNPLMTLEFRAEFDRIRNPEVLEALERVPTDSAHRVTALTFLTLFRCARYLSLADRYANDRETVPLTYVVLSVLRSDLRALTRYLSEGAADAMADGFERDLLGVSAKALQTSGDELASIAASLVSLRGTLEALANALRVESRRTLERDLRPADAIPETADLGVQVVVATATVRASIHHAVHTLCTELRPGRPAPALAEDDAGRRASSERLRRDIWMFGQILRAFLAKAASTPMEPDRWSVHASFQFVREFHRHFRAIGYQLVRESDYERMDPFLDALETLSDVDLVDRARMEAVVAECRAFFEYLEKLFVEISKRAELRDSPFDKRAAADTLKIYLGAA
jgi:hypothetical protein